MKLLFEDKLAPITSEIGFVELPAETVAEWYRAWDESIQREFGRTTESRAVAGSLEMMLRSLEPLSTGQPNRYLFIPARSRWTAYFDNGWRGSDAPGLSYVAREMKCRAIRAAAVPDSLGARTDRDAKGRYGGTIFELYGPEPTTFLNYVRTIGAVNDGGRWNFDEFGERLPFEEPAHYSARRKKDRFPPELLAKYLQAMGIDAFDESFYLSPAVLVERKGPMPPGMREYSLAEARADFGG